jgi:hypothetical protein
VHLERLERIPSASTVFVIGDGDITFCPKPVVRMIIARIKAHNVRYPNKTYLFQSKDPACFTEYIGELPSNALVVTTLETNRDVGYERFSNAPKPSRRFEDFLMLDYHRKAVTCEPLMDFDLLVFVDWIVQVKPERVYVGFNSKPKRVRLPEPSMEKTKAFIGALRAKGVDVRGKNLLGMKV